MDLVTMNKNTMIDYDGHHLKKIMLIPVYQPKTTMTKLTQKLVANSNQSHENNPFIDMYALESIINQLDEPNADPFKVSHNLEKLAFPEKHCNVKNKQDWC